MITPGKHNFTLYQGTTLYKAFTWKQNGVPVDLTGYTGRSQFRATIDSPDKLLDLTSLNGGILIPNPTDGTVYLYATDVQTAALTISPMVYDLELIEPVNSHVVRLIGGTCILDKEVTR